MFAAFWHGSGKPSIAGGQRHAGRADRTGRFALGTASKVKHLRDDSAPYRVGLFARGSVKAVRFAMAAAALMAIGALVAPMSAEAQNRTLSLYNTHTHERLTVTYKRNGRFVQQGVNQLNRFLRDWRRDEATRMDPTLFDLVWTAYQAVGATEPIHVVSAYRSPATNAMLRRNSGGVARNSQHTQGRAIDFFIPGVPAADIRAAALRLHGGGVGYYPRSRTPFVHMDTGSIRHWPRMTRRQLERVFPDGRTVHVPSDGRPLRGYEIAQRELRRGGNRAVTVARSSSSSARADGDGDIVRPGENGGGLLAALFGGRNSTPPADVPAAAPVATTVVAAAASTATAPITVTPPTTAPSETLAASGERQPYNPTAPAIPPNVPTSIPFQVASASPTSGAAGPSVTSPVPGPSLDALQVAALSNTAPGAIAPAPTAVTPPTPAPVAFAPPVQLGQPTTPIQTAAAAASTPSPGQISNVFETRFNVPPTTTASAGLQSRIASALAPPQPRGSIPQGLITNSVADAAAETDSQPLPPAIETAFAAAGTASRSEALNRIESFSGAQQALETRFSNEPADLYAPLEAPSMVRRSIRSGENAVFVPPAQDVDLAPSVAVATSFRADATGSTERSDSFDGPLIRARSNGFVN